MRTDGLVIRRFKDRFEKRSFEGVVVTRHNLDAVAKYFGGQVDGSYLRGTGRREYRVRFYVEEGWYYYADVGQWVLRLLNSPQLMAIEDETLEEMFVPDIVMDESLIQYLKNRTWTLKGSDIFELLENVGDTWDGGMSPDEAIVHLLDIDQTKQNTSDGWSIFHEAEKAVINRVEGVKDTSWDLFQEAELAMINHMKEEKS